MEKVMKVARSVRNNWKKSIAGSVAAYYGVNYAKDSYDCHQMMREYCERAKCYGEISTPVNAKQRVVTVILNPAANKRKAKAQFEKYCAPLLHLAGLSVNVIQTEAEGQARSLTEKLDDTDAIVIAGGDGTLSEVVTGFLRRPDSTTIARKIPLGVLPLGCTNSVSKQLFESADHFRSLAEATMAVICEATMQVDVMQIDVLQTGESAVRKPIFSLVGVEWGAFRDAFSKREKYWYYGPLRGYASYFFTGMKDEASGISWNCEAKVEYKPPCEGCSRCFMERADLQPEPAPRRSWWAAFAPRQSSPSVQKVDYGKVINERCGQQRELEIKTTDFCLLSSSFDRQKSVDKVPRMELSYGPGDMSFFDFVKEGWMRENGEKPYRPEVIQMKEVKIWPLKQSASEPTISDETQSSQQTDNEEKKLKTEEKEKWMSIDHEDYEVKAIQAKLLPHAIKMFCAIDRSSPS